LGWQVTTDPTSNATANTSQLAVLEFNTNGTLKDSYIGATPPATGPTGTIMVNSWGARADALGNAVAAMTLPDGTAVAAGAALPAVPAGPYAAIDLTDPTVNTNLTGVDYYVSAALDANGAVAGGGAVATGVLPQINVTLPPSPNVTTIGLNGTGLISLDLSGIAAAAWLGLPTFTAPVFSAPSAGRRRLLWRRRSVGPRAGPPPCAAGGRSRGLHGPGPSVRSA
ncbi:hypothetical protein P3G55_26470, partial [Leptospira sp. 96542]|nr:hypothetical protein [Leptospira sp. 96542]